jgi:hypothetical protein
MCPPHKTRTRFVGGVGEPEHAQTVSQATFPNAGPGEVSEQEVVDGKIL